jgi:hypothetical protein
MSAVLFCYLTVLGVYHGYKSVVAKLIVLQISHYTELELILPMWLYFIYFFITKSKNVSNKI